jgi:uncharacterized protein (DUF305 family)
MEKTRPSALRLGASALVAALAFAGCSSDNGSENAATTAPETDTAPRIVQPGAPGEDARELTPEELDDLEPVSHTAADVQFMQYMILHHRQALRMTDLVADRSRREDIPLLARRIEISQDDELERMIAWLEERGADAPPPGGEEAHAGHLPGMLTAADLERLEASQGRQFDRRFLEAMIRHHEGALLMVDQLQATPGAGQEPEIAVFAGHVVADQTIEIRRMEALLQELAR